MYIAFSFSKTLHVMQTSCKRSTVITHSRPPFSSEQMSSPPKSSFTVGFYLCWWKPVMKSSPSSDQTQHHCDEFSITRRRTLSSRICLWPYYHHRIKPLGFNHSDGLTSSQKSNIFMLEKSILPYFEKLLILDSLKGLYDSAIGCYSVAFGAKRKSHFTLLLTPLTCQTNRRAKNQNKIRLRPNK